MATLIKQVFKLSLTTNDGLYCLFNIMLIWIIFLSINSLIKSHFSINISFHALISSLLAIQVHRLSCLFKTLYGKYSPQLLLEIRRNQFSMVFIHLASPVWSRELRYVINHEALSQRACCLTSVAYILHHHNSPVLCSDTVFLFMSWLLAT